MDGLLANEGMTEKDVQFVNLPPDQMSAALAKGDVDAACVWQPLLAGLQRRRRAASCWASTATRR